MTVNENDERDEGRLEQGQGKVQEEIWEIFPDTEDTEKRRREDFPRQREVSGEEESEAREAVT